MLHLGDRRPYGIIKPSRKPLEIFGRTLAYIALVYGALFIYLFWYNTKAGNLYNITCIRVGLIEDEKYLDIIGQIKNSLLRLINKSKFKKKLV